VTTLARLQMLLKEIAMKGFLPNSILNAKIVYQSNK
jgi:hypothetical protein